MVKDSRSQIIFGVAGVKGVGLVAIGLQAITVLVLGWCVWCRDRVQLECLHHLHQKTVGFGEAEISMTIGLHQLHRLHQVKNCQWKCMRWCDA